MPAPVSRTRTIASSSRSSTVTSTRPRSGVYFAALWTRLATTCWSRAGSPYTVTGVSGIVTVRCCDFTMRRWRSLSSAKSTTVRRSSSSLRRSILPWLMRATSRRSSSRRARCWVWRAMTARGRVAEDQAAQHLARADDGNREVASERNVRRRRRAPRVPLVAPVGRGDVVEAHGAPVAKRHVEQRDIAEPQEIGEGLAGNAGERVAHDRRPALVQRAIEERAEVRADDLRGGVRHHLGQRLELELGRQPAPEAIERLGLGPRRPLVR